MMMNKKIFAKMGLCLVLAVCASGCGGGAKMRQLRALSQGVPKQVIGAAQLFCDGEPQPTIDSEYYAPSIADYIAKNPKVTVNGKYGKTHDYTFPLKVCKKVTYNVDKSENYLSFHPTKDKLYTFDIWQPASPLTNNRDYCWGEIDIHWSEEDEKIIRFAIKTPDEVHGKPQFIEGDFSAEERN